VNAPLRVLRVLAWPLGLAALAASIVAFALTADLEALGATWRAAASAPAELLAVVVAFGLAFLVRALTWSRVVPGLHPAHALAAIHVSLAGNHLLPLRLGEALRSRAPSAGAASRCAPPRLRRSCSAEPTSWRRWGSRRCWVRR
jgi:hypothetical protein